MRFSFKSLERLRRNASNVTLSRREDVFLPFLAEDASAGTGLLLDTCVYIDQMQGKAPKILEDLLTVRSVNHSTVAMQELMHSVGVLDPDDVRSKRAIAGIESIITAMPPHRVFTPDVGVLAGATVYSGMLCRAQRYAKDDRMRALHDCTLFLQALKLGLCVLTRNVTDFDFLLQLRPEGRVLFYRRADEAVAPKQRRTDPSIKHPRPLQR